MMRWSQLRKGIEDRVTPRLRSRVQLHSTRYRRSADQEGRAWITVDGREVWTMATAVHLVPLWQRAADVAAADEQLSQVEANARAIEEFGAEGRFTQLTFYAALDEYLTLPVDRALASRNVLIRALAMVDRRLGRRRFVAIVLAADDPELVRVFHRLRAEAEGWSASGQVVA
jgi:hypothetical protein